MENRDQLGHRRHLDSQCKNRADNCAHGHRTCEQVIARYRVIEQGGDNGNTHAGDAIKVPSLCALLAAQSTEAQDKQDTRYDIGCCSDITDHE